MQFGSCTSSMSRNVSARISGSFRGWIRIWLDLNPKVAILPVMIWIRIYVFKSFHNTWRWNNLFFFNFSMQILASNVKLIQNPSQWCGASQCITDTSGAPYTDGSEHSAPGTHNSFFACRKYPRIKTSVRRRPHKLLTIVAITPCSRRRQRTDHGNQLPACTYLLTDRQTPGANTQTVLPWRACSQRLISATLTTCSRESSANQQLNSSINLRLVATVINRDNCRRTPINQYR